MSEPTIASRLAQAWGEAIGSGLEVMAAMVRSIPTESGGETDD